MKIINTVMTGLGSIFKKSSDIYKYYFEEIYCQEEKRKRIIIKKWGAVGTAIKGAIDNYEET